MFFSVEMVDHVLGIARIHMGDFFPNISNGVDSYSIREPLGICAGICSFDFPSMIPLWVSLSDNQIALVFLLFDYLFSGNFPGFFNKLMKICSIVLVQEKWQISSFFPSCGNIWFWSLFLCVCVCVCVQGLLLRFIQLFLFLIAYIVCCDSVELFLQFYADVSFCNFMWQYIYSEAFREISR